MASYHLPDELIYEILSRLPVESILRFRSVCKAWAAWSSDQHFAYKHLNANQNNDMECGRASAIHCVIPSSGEGEGEQNQIIVYNCSLQKLIDSQHSNSSSDGCHATKASTRKVRVGSSSGNPMYCIGICNGLMCCDYMGKFVIWNPTTKKTKSYSIASDSGDVLTYNMPTVDSSLGFGFDATTNTYKAILLWYKEPSLGGVGERKVFVCSFPTCRWRRIFQGIPYKPNQATGILFNGALHWLVIASFSSYFIFAVDLTTEQGGTSPVPVRVATGLFHPVELGVLRGCLALLGNDVVWTMKNYGVEDSWEKLFMFPRCEFCPYRSMPLPIWISEKGVAVLCINEFGIVSFDIEQQKFKKIPTHSTTPIRKSWVSKTFAKSLLLPP